MTLTWKKPLTSVLHGADYYPEQWSPDVWKQDVEMMKKAGITTASLGVFAWSHLEPEEGRFDFSWMDEVIGLLKNAGINYMMATPSGARPPWLAQKYPEVLRVNEQGIRNKYGTRHNHCFTSPVYREKTAIINEQLAKKYGSDDSMILWHVSNEYSGDCHCDLCVGAFRDWLKKRYTTLDQLNAAWWGSFWSHRFTDWNQIDPPTPRGERCVHALDLSWKRFVTDQTISFYKNEVAAIRRHDTKTPATSNFMGFFPGLDYHRFAEQIDIASVNLYPEWHRNSETEIDIGVETAMSFDLYRSMKNRPFVMMECTPSLANWQRVGNLKRPGMHALSCIQAVAHGADSVQYFQWRKSRGSYEKFHGAVVDHASRDDSRVFKEVAAVGEALGKLKEIPGGPTPVLAAVIYDWENRWAFDGCSGFRNDKKNYLEEVRKYYRAFWQRSIPCDCISSEGDFFPYRFIVVPILYMVKPGVADRLERFARTGGTVVVTYGSGWVDPDDLIFEGGQPGPLRSLLGLRVEECDALYEGTKVQIKPDPDAVTPPAAGEAEEICERIQLETAKPLARYASEFYSGEPCVTVNPFGKGRVYYVAFRTDAGYIENFLQELAQEAGLVSAWPAPLPAGVNAQKRLTARAEFVFLMNFNQHEATVPVPGSDWTDALTEKPLTGSIQLPAFGFVIARKPSAFAH